MVFFKLVFPSLLKINLLAVSVATVTYKTSTVIFVVIVNLIFCTLKEINVLIGLFEKSTICTFQHLIE